MATKHRLNDTTIFDRFLKDDDIFIDRQAYQIYEMNIFLRSDMIHSGILIVVQPTGLQQQTPAQRSLLLLLLLQRQRRLFAGFRRGN